MELVASISYFLKQDNNNVLENYLLLLPTLALSLSFYLRLSLLFFPIILYFHSSLGAPESVGPEPEPICPFGKSGLVGGHFGILAAILDYGQLWGGQ